MASAAVRSKGVDTLLVGSLFIVAPIVCVAEGELCFVLVLLCNT